MNRNNEQNINQNLEGLIERDLQAKIPSRGRGRKHRGEAGRSRKHREKEGGSQRRQGRARRRGKGREGRGSRGKGREGRERRGKGREIFYLNILKKMKILFFMKNLIVSCNITSITKERTKRS
jgi:hypothetical protein